MPLLGNPTAAVLYPGKVAVRACFPTPGRPGSMSSRTRCWPSRRWGCCCGRGGPAPRPRRWRRWPMASACRSCSSTATSSTWSVPPGLPLGFRAADRWLRLGRRWGLIELAVVLALMVLGGDPESAYVLGIAAGGYAVALTWWPGERSGRGRGRRRLVVTSLIAIVLAVVWVGANAGTGSAAPGTACPRPGGLPPAALPWMRWVPTLVVAGWGSAGLALLAWWWQRQAAAGAGHPAGGPVRRRRCWRPHWRRCNCSPRWSSAARPIAPSIEDPHDIYPFSLEPLRVIELAWPNVFGTRLAGNRSWLEATRPGWAEHTRVWVPSLYLGGLTLVLALGAVGFRRRTGPWRGWLSAVALRQPDRQPGRVYRPALVGAVPPCGGGGARPSRPSGHGHDPARRPAPRR